MTCSRVIVSFPCNRCVFTENDHKHIMCLLSLVSQNMDRMTFKSIFEGKQSYFDEKVNVDDGLLSKLEEYEIITFLQRSAIDVISVTVCKF